LAATDEGVNGCTFVTLLCDGENRSCLTVSGKSSGLPTLRLSTDGKAVSQFKRKSLTINSFHEKTGPCQE